MNKFKKLLFAAVVCVTCLFGFSVSGQDTAPGQAQGFSLTGYMPGETFFYLEVRDLKKNLELLQKSAIFREIEEFTMLEHPDSDKPTQKISELLANPVAQIIGGNAAIGFFKGDSTGLKKPNFGLAAVGDANIVKTVNDFLQSEKSKDKFNNITQAPYKNAVIYSIFPKENNDFKTIYYTTLGNKLFVSSYKQFIQQVIDASGREIPDSMAQTEKYKKAAIMPSEGRIALMYINTDYIKDALELPDPMKVDFGNPLARYFGFQLLNEIKQMDYVVGEAFMPYGGKSDNITVKLATVGRQGQPAAPVSPVPEVPNIAKFISANTICAGFTRVNFAEIWTHFKEFAKEQLKEKIASKEELLDMIFGGMDFEKEVLPSIGREVGFTVSRYELETAMGKVSVPAAVFIVQIKADDEETNKSLKQSVKTLIGTGLAFLSRVNDDIQVVTKNIGDSKMTTVVFKSKKISEIIRPTYVSYGDFIIIGTLPQAVEDAVNAFKNPQANAFPELKRPFTKTGVVLDIKAVLDILSADEDLLIKIKMSEGGAEKEALLRQKFAMLMKIFRHIERASYTTVVSGDGLTTERTLNFGVR
ncbi:MAG: DUF3352 domain-containing protein [Planctomycetes bacterium]|nr:DUF3352 domain-containing protein [Planctomycetota bacterium]